MKKQLTIYLILLITAVVKSQITPKGYFDTLNDQFGVKYALKDLLVDPGPNPDPNQTMATTSSCTAGYFRLYFAIGSGFAGSTPIEATRRNVLCQLFTDISCFIKSPLSSPCNTTTNNTTFVNVLVNNQSGFASGVTMFAGPPNPNVGAIIADNLAYKTIISGVDAYTSVAPPIIANNGFYHMKMNINTNPSIQWYYDLTSITNINSNEYDLYTVGLHEAMHCLGFHTLISPNGTSLLSSFNAYSRYDLRLRANNATTPLLTATNSPCTFSSLQWNPSLPLTTVSPSNCIFNGNTDFTPCNIACKYVNTQNTMTTSVYTPTCYEPGSSLSHFEDECYPINNPANNNQYFVMSNAYGGPNTGIKRYPREEEKIVLCDIGYSVSSQYISPVVGSAMTYTSGACNPPDIWGVNDGIVNNAYVFTGTSQITIPITASVLANDSPNAVTASCISFVYNYPQLQLAVTNGSIVISYVGGPIQCPGLILLQYIPKDINSNPGNLTYIYAYFNCGNCTPNPCNIVSNRGFESLSTNTACLGVMTGPPGLRPNCWELHTNNTPDIFTGNPSCPTTTLHFSFPATFGQFAVNNTYNGSPNFNAVGLVMESGNSITNSTSFEESIKTDLNTALVPTQTYVLSFWAFNSKAFYNTQGLPSILTFATRTTAIYALAANYPMAADNVIANFTLMPSDFNTWKQYTTTIVFSAAQSHKCLIIGQNPIATKLLNNNAVSNRYYTLIDDISLVDINNALIFNPPPTVCNNTCAQQLSQFANQANVVFSGPSVVPNAGDYDFCPTAPGNYTIVASYTNNVGCSYSTQAVVVVPGLSITPSSTLFCNYLNYTLNATPIPTNISISFPNWQPQNINASSVVVQGNNPGPYYLTAGYNSCPLTAFFSPTIVPNSIITSTPDIWCATPNAAYTMSVSLPNFTLTSPLTQTWSAPINSNANPVSVSYSNIINPTYSVITSAAGCTNLATYTATWVTSPTIAIIGGTNCLSANQTVTLQVVPSSTLPLTYTWQPSNSNATTIAVTPTAITIYTLLTSYSNCALTSTVGLYPPPQFTNVPATICSGQAYNYMQNLLSPGTPTNGSFVGFGTYTTIVNSQVLTSFSVPITAPVGNYPVIYSYLTPANCIASNTLLLNVAQGVSLTVPNPTVTYCPNIAVGASVIAISNPTTGVTYTWQPGNINTSSFVATPLTNTTYTLIASIGSCSATERAYVVVNNSCCASTNYVNTSVVNSQTLVGLYAINQDVTILGSVVFAGEFLVAPNVSITVAPSATLSSGQYTPGAVGTQLHMLACTNMWQGINVQNKGKIILQQGDLIEDAKEAVVSDGCTTTTGIDVSLTNVAFNRNDKSVVIRNYNQTTNTTPFEIINCVFTCRNFGFPLYQITGWPTAPLLKSASGPTNTLNSPYLVGNYVQANLKAPISNRASLNGILIENSGITSNPTSAAPIYYGININTDGFSNSSNLFDNLVIGISARNSNVRSYNNIFQNTRQYNVGFSLAGGYGIYALNDNTGPNRNTQLDLVSTFSASTLFNVFYNCHYGIYGKNLYDLNCQYQDFRSTQSSATPFNNSLKGQYGIYSVSNRFKNYNIKNNAFQNVRTGVRIGIVNGPLSLPSIPGFGTYLGKTTISNNLFSPTIGTVAPIGTGFIYYGVYADANLNPSFGTYYEPGASLQITTNNFSRVYRASYSSSTSNKIYNTVNANNMITMVSDANTPFAFQYGIQHVNNLTDIVNTNTIIGVASTLSDTRVAGVYRSANTQGSTQCNSVVSVYAGFHFAGNNQGAYWRNNFMQNNQRGLNLTSNYLLSQQGTINAPSDNEWQGSWVGRNNTFTDGSQTTSLTAQLYVRTSPTKYFPTFNGWLVFNQRYALSTNALVAANNSSPISPCFPVAPPCTTCNPTGLISTMNNIVTNNITYSVNPLETDEINKSLVYRDVTLDPTLLNSNPVLQNFNSVSTASTLGTFNNVQVNLSQGNNSAVSGLLSALLPNTNIENNNKLFYDLYNKYLQNNTLNAVDQITLFILAHQCPFTDGPIVYQARALYSVITEEVKPYNDNGCEQRGFSRMANDSVANNLNSNDLEIENMLVANEKKSQSMFKAVARYDIYPNPANDYFSIISNIKNEKLELRITDVSGKLITKKMIVTNNYSYDLSVDLLSGIYFVNLINEQGQKTTKKLVISKD